MSGNNQVAGQPVNGQTIQVSAADYAALLAQVKALTEAANKPQQGVNFVFGEKGGVTANGLGRFGTTLYLEQWIKLIDAITEQGFLRQLLTWASKGERLLKGAKDETAASILQRTVAYGVSELAKRFPPTPPVAAPPATVPATAQPVAK